MKEIIKFENVSKTFNDGDETIIALNNTNFTVYAGEFVAIIGPSGSGKSTLLTIMGGLQKPSKGKVFLDGIDIANLNQDKLNKLRFEKIGFILQQSNLIPYLTIKEQFEFVDKFKKDNHNKEKAEELMKLVDIYKRKDLYPNDLSGGEKQRAAICRAIYTNPKLILADEPTASLDTNRSIQIVELLKENTKQNENTTIMVTHDDRLLSYFDRVFKIVDGILSEVTNEYIR